MDINENITRYAQAIDDALRGYLKPLGGVYARDLREAMEYGLFPGGKRLRPMLLLGACEGLGGSAEAAMPFACAIEMIHAYSLIHDDLPAMDDDAIRRGQPTCHVRFGEATAILAGDGLLNLAYETMLGACLNGGAGALRAAYEIASGAGACGMVAGQAADMCAYNVNDDTDLAQRAVLFIHANKTARLFEAALAAGAMLAGAGAEAVEIIRGAGRAFGAAFQINDDLADEETDAQDGKAPKLTYITAFGREAAERDSRRLAEEAVSSISGICGGEAFITGLIAFAAQRR